jgi:16S rRNA (cytidine1402-2'-O)-methyltransferase
MPLVLVPTPLGNLGDITLRAIETLKTANLILAEDTRVARKLLSALDVVGKELWSYREANAAAVTPGILERAAAQCVALVSDAGMPAISDPGSDLVTSAREAGIAIEVLPGPSALLGVAVLSGFPLRRFAFEGFPPRASGARRRHFALALQPAITTVWYESPQRIVRSLSDLAAAAPGARVFLVREYTKRFEQQLCGTPEEIASKLPDPVRGEIAFAVAPYPAGAPAEAPDLDRAIDDLLTQGCTVAGIAKQLAQSGAGARRAIYDRASKRKALRERG